MRYWQHFEPPSPDPAVWTQSYAARMPDGSRLVLPLRDLGDTAVAGLIANQASFQVVDRLSGWMAEAVAAEAADIVVGLPTLGHVFGQGVARALGHTQWVAPGTTRKLWYVEPLSVPIASITAPEAGRRMWLDPRLLDRLAGRRVLLVDDVVSTGRSAMAGTGAARRGRDQAGGRLRRDGADRSMAGPVAARYTPALRLRDTPAPPGGRRLVAATGGPASKLRHHGETHHGRADALDPNHPGVPEV